MATTQKHAERISSMEWPPSENTRSLLVEHMINCLSLDFCFSNTHGLLSKEEARAHAKAIEDKAFVAANHHASRCPNADGISTAQLYARETSKLLWDAFQSRSPLPAPEPRPPETESPNDGDSDTELEEKHKKRKAPAETESPDDSDSDTELEEKAPAETESPDDSDSDSDSDSGTELEEKRKKRKVWYDPDSVSEPRPPAETESREAFTEIVEVRENVFDMSRGEFGSVDEGLAEKLFRPFLEESNNTCTKIKLKICVGEEGFEVDAAHVAKRALKNVQKTLTDVELVIFSREMPPYEDEDLEIMSIFSSALEGCTLRSLTLVLDDLVGGMVVRAFGPLLKSQKMLEELKFIDCVISVEDARAICELLPSVERIKCLHFCNNKSGDDAAVVISELLKKCIALEDFELSRSYIDINGFNALVKALSKGSSLKTLTLTFNTFGKSGGDAPSHLIPGHRGLTEVHLDFIHLGDEGVIVAAHSLKDAAPSLRVLTVLGNSITRRAAPALAECLAVKNLLTMFNAAQNRLKDDGSLVICEAILEGHEQLKELNLNANGITGIGAKAVAEAVANKPNFSCLFISWNHITRKGIETVKDVLRKGGKGDSVLETQGLLWHDSDNSDSDSE